MLPIEECGPYPHRLRDQFQGVAWRFRTGSQWREMPEEFGPWPTVYDRFRQWRDAGVFQALMETAIAEAAQRGQVDLSLVSVDSTVARVHDDAAGARVSEESPSCGASRSAARWAGRAPGPTRSPATRRTPPAVTAAI